MNFLCVSTVIFLLAFQSSAPAAEGLAHLDSTIQNIKLAQLYGKVAKRRVKIAVLDNGFGDWQSEIGRTLPADSKYHEGRFPDKISSEPHGLVMAQIVHALMTRSSEHLEYQPELHLYNSFGYTNLKGAVEDAILQKIDIILYSQVWEYGGNFDGLGFINKLVDQATGAGILWINAAGNFGDATYDAPVVRSADDWAQLPGPNQSVQIRCAPIRGKTCQLRLVLDWNDFKNDTETGTAKDLDLVLTDDTLNVVASSGLRQVEKSDGSPGTSLFPREIVEMEVQAGLYFGRVKIRSQNFGPSDRLRLLTSGSGIVLLNKTSASESLLAPADNTRVVTVGASDSEKSSESRSLHKPEIFVDSLIRLKNGETYKGSSNSAAIVAAAVGLWDTVEDHMLNRESVLAMAAQGSSWGSELGEGLDQMMLGFSSTGPHCFVPVLNFRVPDFAAPAIERGGVLVETSLGYRIVVGFDPLTLAQGLVRRLPNDIVLESPGGISVHPRVQLFQLPVPSVEVFQMPREYRLCESPGSKENTLRSRANFQIRF